MSDPLKTTPLYDWHLSHGANMADFAGYAMPLWYESGVKLEHLAVLSSAGMFDTSHMAVVSVRGEHALALLQYCFTRDIAALQQGRCAYGAFLDNNGHCIDDALVYYFGGEEYLVCSNAGMGAVITGHLRAHSEKLAVVVEDLSGRVAKIDIQGKDAARVLAPLLQNSGSVLAEMPFFSFKGRLDAGSDVMLSDGTRIMLSRTGYTGEFGFEIFLASDAVLPLWEALLQAGSKYGVLPCGLAARDSLRAGAVLPLSHQDIGSWKFINHPWPFALSLSTEREGFAKDFVGREALEAGSDLYTYPFVGTTLRKVASGGIAVVLDQDGSELGRVLSCATDMGIDWHEGRILSINSPDRPDAIKGLSCGFVQVDMPLEYGTAVVLAEGRRRIDAVIVQDVRPDRTARKAMKNFYPG